MSRTQPKPRKVRLKVIPEPAPQTRTVINLPEAGPVKGPITGQERRILLCGNCEAALMDGMPISNVVLKCNRCGEFNNVP